MDILIEGWKLQLQQELEIEQKEALENTKGVTVEFVGSSTGLGGRCIVQIKTVNPQQCLLDYRNGDTVQLEQLDKSAVVYKSSEKYIYLAFEDEIDFQHDKLIKLPNISMYKRIDRVLEALPSATNSMVQVCFNNKQPQFSNRHIDYFDLKLNHQQKLAVKRCIESLDIHCIHGPPGTGKTATLIEVIRQFHKINKSILVCGPSNISVDNIVERLSYHKVPCLRMGHPARMIDSVKDKSLEYIVDNGTFGGEVLKDIKQEIDGLFKQVHSCKSGKEKYEIYKQTRQLKKEFNQRERKVVHETCQQHSIHCSTLGNSMSRNLNKDYDVVIIDEIAQATEPEAWLALAKCKKAVIAGDPLQLPPVVKSKCNKMASLETSLMERIMSINNICTMLLVQYRMNTFINEFSSKFIYKNKLVADKSCANTRITDYSQITKSEELQYPVIFYDNLQSSWEYEDENKSKYNEGEISNIVELIDELTELNIPQEFIGIIAAYNAQVTRLKAILQETYPLVEIGTVDGFQGREKEVVVISTVKCNNEHNIGFLSEKRRINVAVSRAKHLLIIFGDSETLERNKFLHNLVEWSSQYDIRYFKE
eukprot:NODE_72_length_23514_cov_0.560624.p2 type:complete len:592 gc:universal NODE_72_length_23514_cov_0.560624:418-2193(+)